MKPSKHLPLFGGVRAWNPQDWTSSDDRVRGGSSISHLECSPSSLTARFHGNLDITTLGGAGFASQRTAGSDRTWDLSGYDGIKLDLGRADGKVYTFTLKDEILPRRDDGRERSSVSWEFELRPDPVHGWQRVVFVRWCDFRPTYRGREVHDAKPLDLRRIKRVGIMVRSFFGEQEGDFELEILSIAAYRMPSYMKYPEQWTIVPEYDEKEDAFRRGESRDGLLGWLTSCQRHLVAFAWTWIMVGTSCWLYFHTRIYNGYFEF